MSNTPYFDEYERTRLLKQSEEMKISPNHCKRIIVSIPPTGNDNYHNYYNYLNHLSNYYRNRWHNL